MPASYRDLGPSQPLKAVADTTTRNPGNWTLTATQAELGIAGGGGQYEIYQATVDGPVGSTFTLYRNTRLWNTVLQGWKNTYDPQQPLIFRPGDSLFFFWSAPISQTPTPTATLWVRYDTSLYENQFGFRGA